MFRKHRSCSNLTIVDYTKLGTSAAPYIQSLSTVGNMSHRALSLVKLNQVSQDSASEPKHRRKEDSEDESLDSQDDSQDSKTSPGKKVDAKSSEWEILEGLRDGQRHEEKPAKQEGYLLKRRKWPMKGYHKRYFTLEKGILTYAKSISDIVKGKYHGTVDIGLSVLTYKRHGRRIDIDAEDVIYHLKAKTHRLFDQWLDQFRQHRLYRQHEFTFGSKDAPRLTDVSTPVEDLTPISPMSPGPFLDRQRGSIKSRSMDRTQSRVTAWLLDSHGLEHWSKELSNAQNKLFELTTLLEKLKQSSSAGTNGHQDSAFETQDLSASMSSSTGKKDKSGKKSQSKISKKDRKSSDSSRLSAPNGTGIHGSSSNPNMLPLDADKNRPISMPEALLLGGIPEDHHPGETRLQEEFLNTAKAVHDCLKQLSRSVTTERERLKVALEQESTAASQGNTSHIQALKQAFTESCKQNADLRAKLARIYELSSPVTTPLTAQPAPPPSIIAPSDGGEHPMVAVSGSWESQSEFYDAAEFLDSNSESSDDDDDEASSEISDTEANGTASAGEDLELQNLQNMRRSKLPVPRPSQDVSIWSLLYKNIGKDLSKISMPVSMNEPLSVLQRLCEELEYTELLDKAASVDDPLERMVLVAAFAVSPYSSTYHRAASKPFNPLLGETYECIREDKGWRFIAEQVSHHPPVSACYCESKNFIFWQDARLKTKFWGKSMEVQPVGTINLKFPNHKDHYKWNKVTTCVHNLLGGQRWVDHHGEVTIVNHSNGLKCKLTFTKSSYWSNKRHEVYGSITDADGNVMHHLFGKWNEAIYCGHAPSAKCIWRPGSMPDDYDLYYGFTRFAIELNELDKEQSHLYAPTDSRFRPDQRLLEEGKFQEAESEKHRIEQMQRERRKLREEQRVTYSPRWFMKTEEDKREMYMYTGKYWEIRKDPGFLKIKMPKLF